MTANQVGLSSLLGVDVAVLTNPARLNGPDPFIGKSSLEQVIEG